MKKIKIGLLSKKRGNFRLQERFSGKENVIDHTNEEVSHHKNALMDAGFSVETFEWDQNFLEKIIKSDVDLFFNVSSLVEAAVLEEYEIPFVGSGTSGIALARNKSLAKKLWLQAGIPTSEFIVIHNMVDCREFIATPPIPYPLFIKPVAGRGSAGITSHSKVNSGEELADNIGVLLDTIGQPVLIERFLKGREITIGLIGNGKNLRALPPLEIRYEEGSRFLTFDKKELEGDSFICPAQLDEEELVFLQETAKKAFLKLGLRDYARVDTKLTPEGFMLLEANSFAGLMCTPKDLPYSYIGFMARAEGKGGKELLKEIINVSLERIGH